MQKADTGRPGVRPGRRSCRTSRRSSRSSPATSSPPAHPAASGWPAHRRASSPTAIDGRHPHRRRRRAAQPLPQGAPRLSGRPLGQLDLMRQGEEFFARPGGATRRRRPRRAERACRTGVAAHVVAHVARNADALGNLLDLGAHRRRDAHVRLGGRAASRHRGLGARSHPAALRDDVAQASSRLIAAADALPAEAWAPPCGRRGAARSPPPRCRGCGSARRGSTASTSPLAPTFADLPPAVTDALLDEVAAGSRRP